MRVYVILDERSSATNPLGDAVETFIRVRTLSFSSRRFRGDDPELASYLRIEERELAAEGGNMPKQVIARLRLR